MGGYHIPNITLTEYVNLGGLYMGDYKNNTDKEVVHIFSLIVDALNIGIPFAPRLELERLREIQRIFDKLSDNNNLEKLKSSSRKEFEPIFELINDKKTFNSLKFKVDGEISEILHSKPPVLRDYLNFDAKFDLYYSECAENYRPYGNYKERKFGDLENLDLIQVKNNFVDAINKQTMKWFLSDIKNYLCVSQEGHYHELWMYHTEALLYNYLQTYEITNLKWDEELSKDLLKSIVGYSKFTELNSKSVISYTNEIRNFIMHILDLISKIFDILQKTNIDSVLYNEILLEVFIFLLNLYHLFPLQDIFDFINTVIMFELDTRDSLSGNNAFVFIKAKEHFEMLCGQGLIGGKNLIKLDYEIPDSTFVNDMWVDQQVEDPSFTTIYIGILFSKVPSPIELEFSFYDKDNKEIILGVNSSDKLSITLGEDVQIGGYYGYRTTILNCSNIYGFKAKLLNNQAEDEYHSIELKKPIIPDIIDENVAHNKYDDGMKINISSNDSIKEDSSNHSELSVWIVLTILFVGLFLIYRFANTNTKLIDEPIDETIIQETIKDDNIPFEFMDKLAERKNHGSLEYISFIDDEYIDLLKELNDDEVLIGIVSTAGLNFRQSNTMNSDVRLVLHEKDKIFIFGENDGWYFGINDSEEVDETKYGWCSKYYIETYVYNFVTGEAISFENYQ